MEAATYALSCVTWMNNNWALHCLSATEVTEQFQCLDLYLTLNHISVQCSNTDFIQVLKY